MLRLAVAIAAAGVLLGGGGPAGSHARHAGDPSADGAPAGSHAGHADIVPLGEGYDPPPPTAPPPPPAATGGRKALVATVGPAFTISLRTAAGKRLGRLRAGRYTITVRDQSAEHNFHLLGPGVNRKTGVAYMGTKTWTVRFRKGKLYRFRCDPHLFSMRGSFRAR
jgi:hypothetical protein